MPASAGPDAAARPADLTGITLTNALGTGWLSATGDGSSRTGPLRNVHAARLRAVSTAPASSTPARSEHARPRAPALVAPEDLSQPPRAPDLNGALEANYPPEARAAGISGMAVVRALISPAGEARALGILSESAPGFGAACLKTLMGSRWSAPVDRSGRAVATEIRYRCTFKVAR
jgi:TonB family protein